jgi:hypothetical protein
MRTLTTCRRCGLIVSPASPICLVCHALAPDVRIDAPDPRRLPFWLAIIVVVVTVAALLHLVGFLST